MTELRKRMIRDMELRRLSPHTQRSYLNAVRGLAKFYHRPPDTLSQEEVQNYLLHLDHERKVAWNSTKVVVIGLRFFFGVTMQNPDMLLAIPSRRPQRRLPHVLSREEVMRIINCVSNRKHRILLMATYSGGLRVSEVVRISNYFIYSSNICKLILLYIIGIPFVFLISYALQSLYDKVIFGNIVVSRNRISIL